MSAHSAKVKPLKVLWLTSSYPRNQDDSASVFLRYLAEALATQHINLQILSPDHRSVQSTPAHNVTSHHFRYFFPRDLQKIAYGSGILPNLRVAPWLFIQIPFFIVAMFFAATWRIIVDKPALIHAHWIFPQGAVAVLLGKLFGIPVLATAHGGDAFALRGCLLGAIKRWTIKHSAAWTSNTRATAYAVGTNLPQPHIIPMGIDYQKFASGNAQALLKASEPRKLILLFVGRLVEKKGVAALLEGMAGLSTDLRNLVELWVIGDGTERDRLQALAVEYGISDQVVFYGRLSNSRLPDYYAAADIFVAPSIVDARGDTEGQGVILLEAMASKTAVISTQTGGIAEIIEHGKTGILIAPNNPKQIADTVSQLILDKRQRQKLAESGQLAAQSYDWQLVAEKFAGLYRLLAA